jgi:hypothetical protein
MWLGSKILGPLQVAHICRMTDTMAYRPNDLMVLAPFGPTSVITGLDLEPIDEIDDVVEPAAGAGADAASGDGNGQMGLAGADATDPCRCLAIPGWIMDNRHVFASGKGPPLLRA